MTLKEIHSLVQQAVYACQERNVEAFTTLFAQEGELIIAQQSITGKAAIGEITEAYFLSCEGIEITVKEILIEGDSPTETLRDRAIVKWFWEDTKKATGKRKGNHNTIKIEFESGLIVRWQEFIT